MPPLPTTLGDPLRPILSESERMQQALRTVLGAGQPEDAEQHLLRKYRVASRSDRRPCGSRRVAHLVTPQRSGRSQD